MLFVTFVMGGPDAAFKEATAILAAHLYDFITVHWPRYGGGRNFLATPAFLEKLFENVEGASRGEQKGHGTAFHPAPRGSTDTSAISSGVSNPFSFQGHGRRLGGS